MAERSLGEHWNRLNPEERAEFKEIFRGLFQDSYAFMVLENLKKEKILYEDEEVNKEVARVKTAMIRPYARILVDYELAPVNGSWLIGDVRIDGVSIVSNYRETFASVINRESYEILLEKMRKKIEAEEIP
jgi:phospholipid transport system substrate-binding protein